MKVEDLLRIIQKGLDNGVIELNSPVRVYNSNFDITSEIIDADVYRDDIEWAGALDINFNEKY